MALSRIYFWLNFFSYQPFGKSLASFIVHKVLTTLAFAVCVILFYVHRDEILYTNDSFGKFADHYKFAISVLVSFVIIVEPLVKCKDYIVMMKLWCSIEDSFKTRLSYRAEADLSHRKLMRKLKIGLTSFLLFYFFCEFNYFFHSILKQQSRLFYCTFLVPTFIIDLKVFQLVYYMMLITSHLKILVQLIKDLNVEINSNQRLKSKVYDSTIRKKYRQIIATHYSVSRMVERFNSSLGLSQIMILQAINFYLKGDFYWISFVFLHRTVNNWAVYGEMFLIISSALQESKMCSILVLLMGTLPKILLLVLQFFCSENIKTLVISILDNC